MRLVDVCIPRFDNETETQVSPPPAAVATSRGFQLPSGLFRQPETEYNVDEDDSDEIDEEDTSPREDEFFEADDGTLQVCAFGSVINGY